ncbi:hypothetical protein Pmani_021342 [Petrolisthes manimaculis]|uniref:Cuticle protein 6 n=1 Tax=Petrolisthes manimaculis TaxID=1843537 RepID=A0AAE1U5K3_9EUCA|nr:hypothetical protein Pmani_021342 [Petrolisthes manimaculis]
MSRRGEGRQVDLEWWGIYLRDCVVSPSDSSLTLGGSCVFLSLSSRHDDRPQGYNTPDITVAHQGSSIYHPGVHVSKAYHGSTLSHDGLHGYPVLHNGIYGSTSLHKGLHRPFIPSHSTPLYLPAVLPAPVAHVNSYNIPAQYTPKYQTPVTYIQEHQTPVTYIQEHQAPVTHVKTYQTHVDGYSAPVTSQYHSQDELGQYAFGYDAGTSSRQESRDAYGNVHGSYSYVDDLGNVQTQHYTAGKGGFRVSGTNLPVQVVDHHRHKRSYANFPASTGPLTRLTHVAPVVPVAPLGYHGYSVPRGFSYRYHTTPFLTSYGRYSHSTPRVYHSHY